MFINAVSLDGSTFSQADELLFLQDIARPFKVKNLYSWQSKENTNFYTVYGQPEEVLELTKDIQDNVNAYGNGIYVALTPYSSSEYGSREGSLLVIKVPEDEKFLDLSDAEVLGELYSHGIAPVELYYQNIHLPILFPAHKRKGFLLKWAVYRDILPPDRFKRATSSDFNWNELNRVRVRVAEVGNNFSLAEIDRIISEAKNLFNAAPPLYAEYLPDSAQKYFWSPFGACFENQGNDNYKLSPFTQRCPELSYEFDSYTCHVCVAVNPLTQAVVRVTDDKTNCRESSGCEPEMENVAEIPFIEYLLPREKEHKFIKNDLASEKWRKYHLSEDTAENNYKVLAYNQYFQFFLKTFVTKDAAEKYLQRLPYLVDLEQYVIRIFRNQRLLIKNIQHAFPTADLRLTPAVDTEIFIAKLKKQIFLQLQKWGSTDAVVPKKTYALQLQLLRQAALAVRPFPTIRLSLPDETLKSAFSDETQVSKFFNHALPGFIVASNSAKKPMIFAVRDNGSDARIIVGYQNGLPMRLSVQRIK